MNKKGMERQIMVVIILGLFLGGMILIVYLGSLVLPLFSRISTDLIGTVQLAGVVSGDQNLSNSATTVLSPVASTFDVFEWVSYGIIIFAILGFLIMCFYVRTYPFFSVIWILIMLVLVGMSLFLSVSYQGIVSQGGYIGDAYTSWENSNFILQYLPHIVLVIGVVGGIIMFILIPKDSESEALTA